MELAALLIEGSHKQDTKVDSNLTFEKEILLRGYHDADEASPQEVHAKSTNSQWQFEKKLDITESKIIWHIKFYFHSQV